MKRQQAWRIEEADAIGWLDVLRVLVGGTLIVVSGYLFLLLLTVAA